MQVNWIGWSSGYEITFTAESGDAFSVFTTRAETLYGASFCALATDHPLIQKWCAGNEALAAFCEECRHKGTSERIIETEEKKGVFTGHYAAHPLQPEVRLPIFAANYVLSDYGTGAIFGCPAHDQRDFDLARAHNLPIL